MYICYINKPSVGASINRPFTRNVQTQKWLQFCLCKTNTCFEHPNVAHGSWAIIECSKHVFGSQIRKSSGSLNCKTWLVSKWKLFEYIWQLPEFPDDATSDHGLRATWSKYPSLRWIFNSTSQQFHLPSAIQYFLKWCALWQMQGWTFQGTTYVWNGIKILFHKRNVNKDTPLLAGCCIQREKNHRKNATNACVPSITLQGFVLFFADTHQPTNV